MTKVIFVISALGSGGAESVISLLADGFAQNGIQTRLLLTEQTREQAERCIKKPNTDIDSLVSGVRVKAKRTPYNRLLFACARVRQTLSRLLLKKDSDEAAILKYKARNENRIKAYRKYLKGCGECTLIVFLNDPIFLSLLSAGRGVRLVISERCDPAQYEKSIQTMAFIRRLYPRAERVVFQTNDAMAWYEKHTRVNGTVISNPVRDGLPQRHTGAREKKVVNFCRISPQKNLILLIDAFWLFHQSHPEYELYIYGDETGNTSAGYLDELRRHAAQKGLSERVHFRPARGDIHELVRTYAMFVSSSDFEGISNSMLEAMAIGLPCICTDCPVGGARGVIRNGENGLLVPTADSCALAAAMTRVAQDCDLAEKMSLNGEKIRTALSSKSIIRLWQKLL